MIRPEAMLAPTTIAVTTSAIPIRIIALERINVPVRWARAPGLRSSTAQSLRARIR